MRVGRVAQLWRHPVKSMRGDRLESSAVTERWGLPGDRGWVVRDEDAGEIVSAKQLADLMRFHSRYVDEPHGGGTPAVELTFPDGSTMRSDDDRVHDALSGVLGRRVRLWSRAETPPDPDDGLADDPAPLDTFFDAMPISLATTAALDTLRAALPDAVVDPRRFRKNIIVATEPGHDGHPEFGWIGRRLGMGEVVCEVVMRISRCRMVTLPQADLPPDRSILRTLARDTGADLGVYLRVLIPGSIHEGDEVRVL